MKARLLFREKRLLDDGCIIEMKMWRVSITPRTPEGLKYSLVYIDESKRRVLGYDNAHGKGHHRHDASGEMAIEFTTIYDLIRIFLNEVKELRGTPI